MSTQTGNFGTVNSVPNLRSWSITRTKANNKQASSALQDGTNREVGPLDWSGSYSAYGHSPVHMPGSYISFVGYKNPSSAGDKATGDILSGSALIQSVAITWDFATNAPISYVANFGGHGDLTESTGAPYSDSAVPTFFPPCVGKIELVQTPTPVRVSHVKQAVLTISKEVKTEVNSGTSAASGKCTTMRYPGGPVDWSLAITRSEGNVDADFVEGAIVELKLYVDATNFWHLKWGMVGDQSGITVNRESGDVIQFTNNIEMKAVNLVTATPTIGLIKLPGAGSNWWPAP